MKKIVFVLSVLLFLSGGASACDYRDTMSGAAVLDAGGPAVGGGTATAACDPIQTVTITGVVPPSFNNWISVWSSYPSYHSVGGGGGSGFYDDGTRGTAQVAGRQPGCLGEQLFMEAATAQIQEQQAPVGTYLSIELGDPLYSDGNWEKYQTSTISRNATPNGVIRKQIIMHYMYNKSTKQVAQAKLKNSFELGCTGMLVPGT